MELDLFSEVIDSGDAIKTEDSAVPNNANYSVDHQCSWCESDSGNYDFGRECCRLRYLQGELRARPGSIKEWLAAFTKQFGSESAGRIRVILRAEADILLKGERK
jgi:hypothetical protein